MVKSKIRIIFLLMFFVNTVAFAQTNDNLFKFTYTSVETACVREESMAQSYLSLVENSKLHSVNQKGDERRVLKTNYVIDKLNSIDSTVDNILLVLGQMEQSLFDRMNDSLFTSQVKKMTTLKDGNLDAPISLNNNKLIQELNFWGFEFFNKSLSSTFGSNRYQLNYIPKFLKYEDLSNASIPVGANNIDNYDKFFFRDLGGYYSDLFEYVFTLNTTDLQGELTLLKLIRYKILVMKTESFKHWRTKISTGDISFSKYEVLVESKKYDKDKFHFNLELVANDINQEQIIELTEPSNIKIIQNDGNDLKFKFIDQEKGLVKVKGVLKVLKLSGVYYIQEWETEVMVP